MIAESITKRDKLCPSRTTRRLVEFDALKGLMILLVIFGHLLDPFTGSSVVARWLFLIIYLVHMPSFIFLAGLFDNPSRGGVAKRITSYLFLFLLLKLIFLVSGRISSGSLSFSLLSEPGIPWFMFGMAGWIALAHATREIPFVPLLFFWITFACAVGYDPAIGDYLCLSRIIVFFPFYLVGYRLNPEQVLRLFKRPACAIAGSAGLLSMVVVSWVQLDKLYLYRGLTTGRNPYNAIVAEGCGAIDRLIWFYLAAAGVVFLLAVFSQIRARWLCFLGKRSLAIYALHWPILMIVNLLGRGAIGYTFYNYGGVLPLVLLSIVTAFICCAKPVVTFMTWFQKSFC